MLVKAEIPRMMSYCLQQTAIGFLVVIEYYAIQKKSPTSSYPGSKSKQLKKRLRLEPLLDSEMVTKATPITPHTRHQQLMRRLIRAVGLIRKDPEQGFNTIPTQASAAQVFTNATIGAKSREQTKQYTAQRFEVEQQETLERRQSSVIIPQKTADGIILVDWYTTNGPANPQNWNSW